MSLFDILKGSKTPIGSHYDKVNKPIHEAMDTVSRQDNPQTRMALYRAFLDGKFLLLEENIQIPHSSSLYKEREISENEEWGMILKRWEDKEILPVFTSEKSIMLYPNQSSKYWAVDARTIFGAVLQTPADKIFVNAFINGQKETYHFWVLNRNEITALAHDTIPAAPGTPVTLDTLMHREHPAEPYPPEWTSKFAELLGDFPEVKKAALFQVSFYTEIQEQKKPYPCLRLLMEKNLSAQRVADKIGLIFEKISGGGKICITSTQDENEFNGTDNTVDPFYVRK